MNNPSTTVGSLWLSPGRHAPGEEKYCAMERAAETYGESHSDHPKAVHAILADFCRSANDWLSDGARQLLAVLIEPLKGSSELALQAEDVLRVEVALQGIYEDPSPATASVFVAAVHLAISRGTPGSGIIGVVDPRVGNEATQAAAEEEARFAQEAEGQPTRKREEALREEQETRRLEAEQRKVEAERVAQARRVEIASAPLSESTVYAAQRLLRAASVLGRRALPTGSPRPLLPENTESVLEFMSERVHAYRR